MNYQIQVERRMGLDQQESDNKNKFSIGENVMLKSGGPIMSVVNIRLATLGQPFSTLLSCVYFDDHNMFHEMTVPEQCLKRVT